jgi:hypothetical protein
MPFLSCKFFASQKTYETITADIRVGLLSPWSFASQNSRNIFPKGFWFCGVCAARKLLGFLGGVWGFSPNSENQNA